MLEYLLMPVLALFSVIVTIFVVLIFYTTDPAWAIVKAKFQKKPLLLIVRRDRRVEIVPVNTYHSLYVVKHKDGRGEVYIPSPNSAYLLKGVGTLSIALERYGPTLPRELLLYSNVATQNGIRTLEEAKARGLKIRDRVTGETVRVEDVEGFFKFSFSPDIIYHAAVEISRSESSKSPFKLDMKVVFIILFLAMVAAVVLIIMRSGGVVSRPHIIPPVGGG